MWSFWKLSYGIYCYVNIKQMQNFRCLLYVTVCVMLSTHLPWSIENHDSRQDSLSPVYIYICSGIKQYLSAIKATPINAELIQ